MSKRIKLKYTYYDEDTEHVITGTMVVGDLEGDPSVPNGTREVAPYLTECYLDGEPVDENGDDATELMQYGVEQ